ncbi:MAG: glycosyltransferase [Gemmatimonadales bacterium]|nr:glycosyltransferase [Gemmatimonadales bacterium]
MLYVCITTQDNVSTIGLLLWKLRKVFHDFPREYHILVADDASTDGTAETLETYQRALPLTLIRQRERIGATRCLEVLLHDAVTRSDRLRRDCVVTLPADFSHSPAVLPDLVRRFESGADVIIGESDLHGQPLGIRLVRRWAPWLLRPGVVLPGVRDVLSGVALIRLVTLKNCLREGEQALLEAEGLAARAELVARASATARQISVVTIAPHTNGSAPEMPIPPLTVALSLFRAGRTLRIPRPETAIQRT